MAMNRILTPADRDALAELIANIERNTAGELVTVVLRRSASYVAYRIGWAAGGSLLLTAVAHLLWPAFPTMELLGAEATLALVLYWFFGHTAWLRLMVPRAAKVQATTDRAKRLFLELGVTETRDRSGVLIVLSELERRVQILGDRGIHQQLGADAWKQLVDSIVSSIRAGRPVEGLRSAIEKIGQELVSKFPPRPDDLDELPNHVIVQD